MPDARHLRISRELFLTAFGANVGAFESWVTDRLTNLVEEEEIGVGNVLFSSGEPSEFFYFMREGRVQLAREGSPACVLAGRQVFGMEDALLDRTRTRTAVALADLQLMKVRIEDWLELLDDSFELARASVLALARSVADHEQALWASGTARVSVPPRSSDTRPGRLTVIDRLAVLTDVPLLRGAGVQPLSDLAVTSGEVFFEAGEAIFERAVPRDRILILIDGEIEVSRTDPAIVRRQRSGDIVCGAAALGEPALAWQARASKASRALTFRIEDWFDLMEEHFDMVRSALGSLEQQRYQLLDQLASIAEGGAVV